MAEQAELPKIPSLFVHETQTLGIKFRLQPPNEKQNFTSIVIVLPKKMPSDGILDLTVSEAVDLNRWLMKMLELCKGER